MSYPVFIQNVEMRVSDTCRWDRCTAGIDVSGLLTYLERVGGLRNFYEHSFVYGFRYSAADCVFLFWGVGVCG